VSGSIEQVSATWFCCSLFHFADLHRANILKVQIPESFYHARSKLKLIRQINFSQKEAMLIAHYSTCLF
jgi:hypothetical protein